MDRKKIYIIRNQNGEIGATNVMAQGEQLATLKELEANDWLFERFPNAVLIVKGEEAESPS